MNGLSAHNARQDGKKRSRTQKRFLPHCAYCGEAFQPRRRDQKYCHPERERKLNCERKQALAGAVARQFRRWGWKAQDLLTVARRCVAAAYESVLKAMVRLGWRYDEQDKIWRLA